MNQHAHPTGRERLENFEAWRERLPARQNALEIQREIEAIARRLEPTPAPRPRPHISREDIEINAAEQRCIGMLERMNRRDPSQAKGGL